MVLRMIFLSEMNFKILLLLIGGIIFSVIMCIKYCMEDFIFWFVVVGFFIIVYCMIRNIRGVMIYGIVFVMGVLWFCYLKVYFFI